MTLYKYIINNLYHGRTIWNCLSTNDDNSNLGFHTSVTKCKNHTINTTVPLLLQLTMGYFPETQNTDIFMINQVNAGKERYLEAVE